mmetsp:Transcript_45983/g.137423  ORF Transcript_45983/g.137423 Transcript_45983/m.137423 type:complete len:1131 (+) Transcript_45983:227-3619(+)
MEHDHPALVGGKEGPCQQGGVHIVEDDEQLCLQGLHGLLQVRGEIGRSVDARATAAVGFIIPLQILQTVAEEAGLRETPISQDLVSQASGPCHSQRVAVGVCAHDGHKHRGRGWQRRGLHKRLQGRHLLGACQDQDAHAGNPPGVLQRGQHLWEGQRDAQLRQHQPAAVLARNLHGLRALDTWEELTDDHGLLPLVSEEVHNLVDILLAHDQDHAQTAVEGRRQLLGSDLPHSSKPAEGNRQLPRRRPDVGCKVRGQDLVKAARQAATCHLRRPQQQALLGETQDRLHVDPRSWQQRVPKAARRVERRSLAVLQPCSSDDAPHEREAVGVHARRRQRNQHIASLHCAHVRQQGLRVHGSHSEADEVVAVGPKDARQLRDARVHEGAARLHASLRDALDHLHRLPAIQLGCREVLVEEEWLGTPGRQVVCAERDQVNAHSVEAVALRGDHHLGTNVGRCTDECTAAILHHAGHVARLCIRLHRTARAHDPGAPREGLETGHGCLARIVVDTRGSVGELLWSRWWVEGHCGWLGLVFVGKRGDGSDVVTVPRVREVHCSHPDVSALARLGEASAHRRHRKHTASATCKAVRDLRRRNVVQGGHPHQSLGLRRSFGAGALVLQGRTRVEDVRAWHAERPLQPCDGKATAESARVASARHDDGHHAGLRHDMEGAPLEPRAGAGREHLEEVAVEEWKGSLRGRISQTAPEGEDLGSAGHDHELRVQTADERPLVFPQAVENGPDDVLLDACKHIRVDEQGRGEGSHTVGDGPAVLVQRPLVVLHGRREDRVAHAVGEGEHRNLGAAWPLLQGRFVMWRIHHLHALLLREGARERPGRVNLRRGLRRSKNGHACATQHIRQPLGEHLLGAHDGKGDGTLFAEVADLLEERRCQRHINGDQGRRVRLAAVVVFRMAAVEGLLTYGAAIARRDIHAAHLMGEADLPRQGVLRPAVADDQHGGLCTGRGGAHAVAARAAALHPENEGTAASLDATWGGVVASEVPVACMLWHCLMQGVHSVVEDLDFGRAVTGRDLSRNLLGDLLGSEGVVDTLHMVDKLPAVERLSQLRAACLVDLVKDVAATSILQHRDCRLESRKVPKLGHVDAVHVREADLRAAGEDHDALGAQPVQRPEDGIL